MSASAPLSEQNDAFRQGQANAIPLIGKRLHTAGVEALGLEHILDIWRKVAGFEQFTPDNDPHSEHDFGSFDHPHAGKIFWKIDYYDLAYARGSENPSDPRCTRRVLTVMLASEY